MCGEKSREKMTGLAFLIQWTLSYDQNSSDMARWHKLATILSILIRFQNIVAAADLCVIVVFSSNWIGYVAVSNDKTTKHFGRRDVAIAWRGTVTRLEWVADLMDFLKPVSAREQILAEVKRLTEMYADEETSITLTGHSSGSALVLGSRMLGSRKGSSHLGLRF
ncbi:hypothetical protein DKX38_002101 [Salix brachista]|uniref:Fungal lipase-type domain-containing protein n=1 Tax=Salix brachista TaxID=2182728 RepID=A0A5N5NN29_9ROSI|nr:hypothetical protein DKX38_002101 [Salix brachista]